MKYLILAMKMWTYLTSSLFFFLRKMLSFHCFDALLSFWLNCTWQRNTFPLEKLVEKLELIPSFGSYFKLDWKLPKRDLFFFFFHIFVQKQDNGILVLTRIDDLNMMQLTKNGEMTVEITVEHTAWICFLLLFFFQV